jgi:hypothetical protein
MLHINIINVLGKRMLVEPPVNPADAVPKDISSILLKLEKPGR